MCVCLSLGVLGFRLCRESHLRLHSESCSAMLNMCLSSWLFKLLHLKLDVCQKVEPTSWDIGSRFTTLLQFFPSSCSCQIFFFTIVYIGQKDSQTLDTWKCHGTLQGRGRLRVCVCCFVLLNRYWGIVTVPGSIHYGSRPGVAGSSPSTLTTSLAIPVPSSSSSNGPSNYSVENHGLVPWRLRRLGRSKVRSASLVRV